MSVLQSIESNSEVLPVVQRADWVKGPPHGHWTYADYVALPEDGHRYEIIEGVLYIASSPNFLHQNVEQFFE